jgi:hypothetical protein
MVTKIKTSMKIILLSLILMISLITSSYAINQNELLRYEFEEGSGTIALDTSNNGNHLLLVGATFDSTQKRFDNFALRFSSSSHYGRSITSEQVPPIITFSFWSRRDNFNNIGTYFEIVDNFELQTLGLRYNGANGETYFCYRDVTSLSCSNLIYNTALSVNTWFHHILTIDYNNNSILYYVNNNLVYSDTLVNPPLITPYLKTLTLGNNNNVTSTFQGRIDSFRIFDSYLTIEQINTLYTTNNIELIKNETEQPPITINQTNIINTLTPLNNSNVLSTSSINAILNSKADCSLYINNNLIRNWYDIASFSYDLNRLEAGTYSYFIYCENTINETMNYEFSSLRTINVTKPNRNIEFFLLNNDNVLISQYEDLYLVTPCFKKTELSKYYIPTTERYIQKINNGYANYNLSYEDNFEFCLLKGRINAIEDKYSLNYDVVNVEKQIDLGTIFVGENTYSYVLKIDENTLYKVTNPKFWGETWQNLFILILALLVGGGIIILGIISGMVQLSVVGGVIIALGLGLMLINMIIKSIFG